MINLVSYAVDFLPKLFLKNEGWGDGSEYWAFAVQAQGPESKSQHLYKMSGVTMHVPATPVRVSSSIHYCDDVISSFFPAEEDPLKKHQCYIIPQAASPSLQ